MAEQDHQHHPGRDDAEERGHLELLQKVGRGQEVAGIERARDQQHGDEAERDQDRLVDRLHDRLHDAHPNSSRRLRIRNTRAAPRLTASSRMTPWNKGCQSGGRSNTNKQVLDRAQHEGAEDRADRTADAAVERGAADHDRRDRVEGVGAADRSARLAGIGDEGQHQAGDRAQEAGQRIGRELGAADPDPGHIRRPFGGARGVAAAADHRAPERHPDHDHDHREQDQRGRDYGEHLAGHEVGELLVDVAARDRPDQQRDAVVDGAGRERRDDRLQAPVDHDRAVDQTGRGACEQHDHDPERGLERPALDDRRGDAVGHHEHHADREVEAAGQDRQGLGHGDQREQHALVGRGLGDRHGQPGRIVADVEREHQHEQDDREQQAVVLDQPEAELAHQPALCSGSRASIARLSALATMLCSLSASPSSSRTILPS